MMEQVQEQDLVALVKKLTGALDEVLAIGDWNTSLFLRASASRLKELRDQVEKLCNEDADVETDSKQSDANKDALSEQKRVFVLLYQADVEDLQGWFHVIQSLIEYGTTRPVYQNESDAQEFIRSKAAEIDHNGYVTVSINNADIINQAEVQQDSFGHPLVALKEKAIKLEDVVEFIHANKKRYVIKDNKLEFSGEI